jgi:hypothetical protein
MMLRVARALKSRGWSPSIFRKEEAARGIVRTNVPCMEQTMRYIHINDKSRLNSLRRHAHRNGMRLEKSRQRSFHSNNRGGLMLIDNYFNIVRAGVDYDLDLETAEYWIEFYSKKCSSAAANHDVIGISVAGITAACL